VLAEAGLPHGVLNVVTTSHTGEFSQTLQADDRLRKVSFTGSTPIGKRLVKQSADQLQRVSMELGGNAPFLVLEDADLDAAVTGAIQSKYRNTGQTCVCANRFIVHSKVYDAFTQKLIAAVQKLRVGDGLKGETDQGPLIDTKALAKVEAHIADAQAKGATVVTGGHRHALGGTFYEPTVLTNVNSNMILAREETFGPVAPLFRVDSDEAAVKLANDTEFGLAAYVYTRDLARSWRVTEALEYGIVGLNTGLISTEVAPFGGIKESGIGREGSKYGILEFTELKYICVGGI
jgi:succinate-semialdehyde dehydrogenase/glutarate-semialdehyde dehydrogenase